MKHIIILMLIANLSVSLTYAQRQTDVTMDEFRESFTRTSTRLRAVEPDTAQYIGRPFLEFINYLEKQGLEIVFAQPIDNMRVPVFVPDDQKINGIFLRFADQNTRNFARRNSLVHPTIQVIFSNNLPSIEAWDLLRKYDGAFTEEVRAFYSDAIIEAIGIWIPERMEQPQRR